MNKLFYRIVRRCAIPLLGRVLTNPKFISAELHLKSKMPGVSKLGVKERWLCIKNGFNSDKYITYEFDNNDYKLYLPDAHRYELCEKISKAYYYIVHDKICFQKYFSGQANFVPILCFLNRGNFMRVEEDFFVNSIESLMNYLRDKDLFLKPYNGGGGVGTIKIVSVRNEYFSWNGERLDVEELISRINNLENYIVEPLFIQHGYASDIINTSLNTMRIITLIDPVTKRAFIPSAVQRFSSHRNMIMDNYDAGGIIANIDLETGIMSKATRFPVNGYKEWFECHPDTNKAIEGVQVTSWDEVKKTVLRLANSVPFLPYLGWDVFVDEDKVYVQEANYNPSIYLNQSHNNPLYKDERVRCFFAYYGIIK